MNGYFFQPRFFLILLVGLSIQIASMTLSAASECLRQDSICDSVKLERAASWGMPDFLKIGELVDASNVKAHVSRHAQHSVVSVRGSATKNYPIEVLGVIAGLRQQGFSEQQIEFGPRVFTTKDDNQMVVIDLHSVDEGVEVSIAYWHASDSKLVHSVL